MKAGKIVGAHKTVGKVHDAFHARRQRVGARCIHGIVALLRGAHVVFHRIGNISRVAADIHRLLRVSGHQAVVARIGLAGNIGVSAVPEQMRFGKVNGIRVRKSVFDRVGLHTGDGRIGPAGVSHLQLDVCQQTFRPRVIGRRKLTPGAFSPAGEIDLRIREQHLRAGLIEPDAHHKPVVAGFVFGVIQRFAVPSAPGVSGQKKALRYRRQKFRFLRSFTQRPGDDRKGHGDKKSQHEQNGQTGTK